MRIISYSSLPQHYECINPFIKSFNCEAIHIAFQGPEDLNIFFKTIQRCDVIVIYNLQDLFQHIESFLAFLRFRESHAIRIISIDDKVDSDDKAFSTPCSARILDFISNLSKKRSDSTPNDIESDLLSKSKHDLMLKRHSIVINLYTANYKIKDIQLLSGYKSKKTIYLILKRYGIDVEFPKMRRETKKVSHISTASNT